MKHEFILADVNVSRPGIAVLNCEIRTWKDADPTTGAADFSDTITQQAKTHVEGFTTAQLLDRVRKELTAKAQEKINIRAEELQILSKQALADLITDIDGTLTS